MSDPFPDSVVKAAWVVAGGKCQCMDLARCGHQVVPHWRLLKWEERGKDQSIEGWEADHRNPDGPPELENCRILCMMCHKNTPSYGRRKDRQLKLPYAKLLLQVHQPEQVAYLLKEIGLEPSRESVDLADAAYTELEQVGLMEKVASVTVLTHSGGVPKSPYRLTVAGQATREGGA
jgi:hypothetical protein